MSSINFTVLATNYKMIMVGDGAVGWNPFLVSLVSLAQELEKLELVYYDGSISYVGATET